MLKVYLGCDLFVEGQRIQAMMVQELLEEKLGDKVDIYNPAANLEINDKSAGFTAGYDILIADYEELKDSDIIIGLMDTEDTGLAVEMGIAFERGMPIYQLYTDIRLGGTDRIDKVEAMQEDIFQNDFLYLNKLVTGLSYIDKNKQHYEEKLIFQNKEDLVEAVVRNTNK